MRRTWTARVCILSPASTCSTPPLRSFNCDGGNTTMTYAWKSSFAALAILLPTLPPATNFLLPPRPLSTSLDSTSPLQRQQSAAPRDGPAETTTSTSWLPTGVNKNVGMSTTTRNTDFVETSTLQVPLNSYLSSREEIHQGGNDESSSRQPSFWREHGLLCLERTIPADVSRGLHLLVKGSSPFKSIQVVAPRGGEGRGGGGGDGSSNNVEHWTETLTAPLIPAMAVLNIPSFESSGELVRVPSSIQIPDEVQEFNAAQRRSTSSTDMSDCDENQQEDKPLYGGLLQQREGQQQQPAQMNNGSQTDMGAMFLSSTGELRGMTEDDMVEIVSLQAQKSRGVEAWHWLKEDVEQAANLFADEVLRQATAQEHAPSVFSSWLLPRDAIDGNAGGEAGHVSVKLELLERGKCPRFHLDKVPLRLICTYVGPSTEWVDGYGQREMDQNRSPPSACNVKISGGREVRHANTGDLLIFRGKQPRAAADMRAVAHRSPDMDKDQRRLVLTIDIGDITRA